jgi:lysophospholipase L1-like esterase
LPLSTATMPTISVTDPTGVTINGTANPTARNVEQEFQNTLQGNSRYFVIPSSVTINKAQASAFLALRPDFSGSGEGDPFMSLYEVGTLPLPPGSTGAPATYPSSADAFDLISTGGGLQGLTHVAYTTSGSTTTASPTESFSGGNIAERSQQTVVGLVTSPGSAPLIYLDGVSHSSGGTAPASANCSGGYLLAGVGTGYFYGIPLFANYNFLGFALYSGTVSSSTAASISSTMLPRTVPAFNIVASGDSITQGTGSIDGWNTLHYAEPLLNHPADITNTAVEGSVTAGALGDTNYPTIATSLIGNLYNSSYTKNIYYLASGTNDLHEASTGAAAWANDMQALENAKSLGFKTVVATVMHEYGETAAQATEVNNFNTLARAAVGSSYLDAIVDYAADVRLGNSGIYYPAYSGDGTHPNEAGYQVMGTIAAPVFNSIIGP